MPIEPDTKDWTWVLRERCPDCGFDASAVDPVDLPALLRDTVPGFTAALADDDARVRPADNVWSPLEYACHVRDVHLLFDLRLRQMLSDDDPLFANWDQDETAVAEDYPARTRPRWLPLWPRPPRWWRRRTTGSARTGGSARGGAATARCSPRRAWGATTCTTSSTTCTTSGATPGR